ncbi:hypothetical protein [Pedobacter gandavensis]|uniref:hypothetical protein n=1 Tax=Pedobacter gandavensis TaxID=2679963 RepID=UPI00397786DC
MTVWHEEGTVSQKGYFKEGKADGTWKTFFKSGKIKSISSFKDGKKNGEWVI